MKYFIHEEEREGTDYFEFQPGVFDEQYWSEDSLDLSAEIFDEFDLDDIIEEVAREFDYYGITIIKKEQWEEIKDESPVFVEMQEWANHVFEQYDAFTIIGL